jgi:thiol-disulfide isomerase/thioredoxin
VTRANRPGARPQRFVRGPRPGRAPRRRLLYYGAAVAGIVLVASAVYGLVIPRASVPEVKVGAPAPDVTFTTVDGAQHRLSEFHGRPVMFWLFATWCPSCQGGTAAMVEHLGQLDRARVQIIQLELYNNLGYPGPSVQDFARAYARGVPPTARWLWGTASQTASYTYDPRAYPDIYFLIDAHGIVRGINGSPDATMAEILSFAQTAW